MRKRLGSLTLRKQESGAESPGFVVSDDVLLAHLQFLSVAARDAATTGAHLIKVTSSPIVQFVVSIDTSAERPLVWVVALEEMPEHQRPESFASTLCCSAAGLLTLLAGGQISQASVTGDRRELRRPLSVTPCPHSARR